MCVCILFTRQSSCFVKMCAHVYMHVCTVQWAATAKLMCAIKVCNSERANGVPGGGGRKGYEDGGYGGFDDNGVATEYIMGEIFHPRRYYVTLVTDCRAR